MSKKKKRYEDSVQITVRVPRDLRNQALEALRKFEDGGELAGELLHVPGTTEKVKPSIAVLMLRGLDQELGALERLREILDSRAEFQKKRDKMKELRASVSEPSAMIREGTNWDLIRKPSGKVHVGEFGAEACFCCGCSIENAELVSERFVPLKDVCRRALANCRTAIDTVNPLLSGKPLTVAEPEEVSS